VEAVAWTLSYVLPAALSGWAAHAVATRRFALRPLWTTVGIVVPVLGAILTALLAGRFAWEVQEPGVAR